ncbi:shikimate O-hydroxycinnamoyltransferase-like [Rutidosis leptorrhynchoides]|uniref:shikimate O-hydroxycinnamoyltransferase-like n=1 Tax=Rutidosis leptorrhynchoides TaxID=125765 RepID=UPI003A99C863
MKIQIKKSTIVKPAEKTAATNLYLSTIDLTVPNFYTLIAYFYRPNGAVNFFDTKLIKDGLSKALVAFYPMAGRFKKDKHGRFVIDCQEQGVLFVEAESDGVIEDFGDFSPSLELQKLTPNVDCSLGIESCPLLITQVTHFKCGGVSVGIGLHHFVADGVAELHFIKSWSDMVRGVDLTLQPFIDRTVLRARDPPQPIFEHTEYRPCPYPPTKSSSLKDESDETPIASIFKLTRDQLNVIKAKSKEGGNTNIYGSFEMLAAHIWRSVCKARGLLDDQVTTLVIPVDGRTRLEPALPPGYFGNVILVVPTTEVVGELQSNPMWYAANKIHDTIVLRNNAYYRSAIDYLELQPDIMAVSQGANMFRYPNLGISSWTGLSVYDVDFGWGQPIFMGPTSIAFEGICYVIPNPINDGSISVVLSLQAQHMKLFSNIFYEIFINDSSKL